MEVVKLAWFTQVLATRVELGYFLKRGSRLGFPPNSVSCFLLKQTPPLLQCVGRLGNSVRSELTDKIALIN